jgi:hypothetical protein
MPYQAHDNGEEEAEAKQQQYLTVIIVYSSLPLLSASAASPTDSPTVELVLD